MDAPTVREQVIAKLDELSVAQLTTLLRYVEVMKSYELPDDYDEDNDPTVGLFAGPADLAERSREILRTEFGRINPHDAKKVEE